MIRLTTGIFDVLLNIASQTLELVRNEKVLNLLMYSLFFVCIFTSSDWTVVSTKGELFRFDRYNFMRKIDIYSLYAIGFFVILFIRKIIMRADQNFWGEKNYLKNIFWMYFVPVNILIYLSINIKNITLEGLGVLPVSRSFIYLSVLYFIQDIFLKNKNKKQLVNILTVMEALLFLRCSYSIVKYYLGYGTQILERGLGLGSGLHDTVLRIGQENDFADFFILLFIIGLTRLLFDKNENKYVRILHIMSVMASSYISIMSFRRFTWGEYAVAVSVIMFFHYHFNKEVVHKKIILICFVMASLMSSILYIGPANLQDNYYIGRFMSILSLVDSSFESKYGTDTHHIDEIQDGWLNVKNHWLLGVTFFGGELMERPNTQYQKTRLSDSYSVFVHNNYLYIWLTYGLLGFLLLLALYLFSLRLGYVVYVKFKNSMGLILLTFMLCQMVKNMVWHTAIALINETIVYCLLISIVIKLRQLLMVRDMKNSELSVQGTDTA